MDPGLEHNHCCVLSERGRRGKSGSLILQIFTEHLMFP